ncbi:EAL domain-containing protein [Acidihalobacter prosperus]
MATDTDAGVPTNRMLRALVRGAERLPFPVLIKDGGLRWRYANEAACELFGLQQAGYQHQTDTDLLEPGLAGQMGEDDRTALSLREMAETREVVGGRSFRVFRYPLRDGDEVAGLVSIALEVTELEAARLAFERQRDFYMALSEVNQAVIRDESHTPADLYDSVCRVIVQHTAAIMAVIARVDHDKQQAVFVHQREKFAHLPTLRGLHVSLDAAHPHGQGATARAVREGRTIVVNDVLADPGMAPWNDLHREYGVHSAIAVPVTLKGNHEIVLIVYAAERDFFTPDLVHLLRDMADDVGFSVLHQRQAERLRHLALYDSLTGLPNRLWFFERAAALANGDVPACALLVLDIDDFKFYNDLFGNEAGDALLTMVGGRLQALCSEDDVIGRMGSDEFGLMLCIDGKFDEEVLQQRVANVLTESCELGWDAPVTLGLSGGYALYPRDGRDVDTLVRRAGMALQAVKTEGGNQLRGYLPAQEENLDRRREVRAEIERALAEGRVEPWFQPQVDLLSGEVIGLEALARLRTEEGAVVTPDWFIDVVEADATLIRRLGVAMLDGVGVRLSHLKKLGLEVPVSVNIGARHLLAPGFRRDLTELLERHPQLAERLEIEITEAESLADMPRAVKILHWVRERGLGVALDDFGSGYASVGNVRQLPLTTLKLDQEFVRNLPASVDDQTIVSAVVVGVRGLGVRLIAEGVETDEHAELLGALGLTLLQGYAISRPLPLSELERWSGGWQRPASWRLWARPASTQGSALVCVGAWFGLRRWLARPDLGEPQAVSRFRERLQSGVDFGCPPPLSEFRSLFISLSERVTDAVSDRSAEGVRKRDQLLAEVDAMGRMMRRAIGRSSLIS